MTVVIEETSIPVSDISGKKYTTEEFLSLSDIDGDEDFYENYELISGEIVPKIGRKVGPSGRQGEIINNLGAALFNFVKPGNLGRVFSSSPCFIKADDYLIPDIAFVA